MAAFLPIVAVGSGAIWMVSNSGMQAREYEPTEEERRRETQILDMEHNGANASVFQNRHNESFLMGMAMGETLSMDNTGGGYNPNKDVLQDVFQQHADLEQWDRTHTFHAFTTAQGEIKMRSRGMPIAATLTPELYHPNDPSYRTDLAAYQGLPNWANTAQLQAMKRQRDSDLTPEQQTRRYYDGEFFNRAPGQSFRYE
jgi:hypothetical protein